MNVRTCINSSPDSLLLTEGEGDVSEPSKGARNGYGMNEFIAWCRQTEENSHRRWKSGSGIMCFRFIGG